MSSDNWRHHYYQAGAAHYGIARPRSHYEQYQRDQAAHDHAPYGQFAHDQAPYGQFAYDQAPYGQFAHDQARYGQFAYDQARYERSGYERPGAPGAPQAGAPGFMGGHSSHWAHGWFEFSDPGYVKGLVLGAGLAYVLTNPKVQRALVKGAVSLWSTVQGGFEEVKEQIQDIKSEMSMRHDEPESKK